MTLNEIKGRFKGTPYEEAIAALCDKVEAVEVLLNVITTEAQKAVAEDARHRPQADKPDQARAR
jgi:hypothetical protein